MQPPFDLSPLLRAVLTPLVRIALSCGVTYQAFSRTLRRIYFDVASDFERMGGKPNSDSRIAVLTGLPRREVRTLREHGDEDARSNDSFGLRVLGRWTSSLEFLDGDGNVLPLPRTLRQGGEHSFEGLVASVSKDVRSRALLDEWLRKGNVVLDDQDRVVLTKQTHREDANGASLILGHVLHDMLAGFDRHYFAGRSEQGVPSATVTGYRLSDESIKLVVAKAYDDAMQMLRQLNRFVVEREALDARHPDAWNRFTFSFAVYRADQRVEPGVMNDESSRDPQQRPPKTPASP